MAPIKWNKSLINNCELLNFFKMICYRLKTVYSVIIMGGVVMWLLSWPALSFI